MIGWSNGNSFLCLLIPGHIHSGSQRLEAESVRQILIDTDRQAVPRIAWPDYKQNLIYHRTWIRGYFT
jgi:hypothetical protein